MTRTRKRFDEELVDRLTPFGKELLAEIPELEVIAFVPAWGIPQDSLMPAMFMANQGSQSPNQIMLMLDRLTRATDFELRQLQQLITAAGQTANEIAREINDRHIERERVNTALQAATAELAEKERQLEAVNRQLAETQEEPHQ